VTSPESTYGSFLVRLNDPERRLFIATIDNSACGYVDCKIVRIDEGGRRMPCLGVCIHHLAVEYGYRRMGVAQRLIQAVEDRAREIGASCLELTVFEGNKDALKMYERVGFQTEKRTMTRSVESNKDESGLQMKKERQDDLPCKIIE
jgi:ribosomal protein S18 acetylase RimI-like enzyme